MLGINLGECDVTTVETTAAANGMLPKGRYHARLTGSCQITSQRTGNTGYELEFEVASGPFAGSVVKDTAWLVPEGGSGDHQKDEKTRNRLVLLGSRLGLCKPNPAGRGYVAVEGKESFGDCLGAEVVVEVSHRTWKRDDGSESTFVNLTYGGIYSLDSKEGRETLKNLGAAAKVGHGSAGNLDTPQPQRKPRVSVADL